MCLPRNSPPFLGAISRERFRFAFTSRIPTVIWVGRSFRMGTGVRTGSRRDMAGHYHPEMRLRPAALLLSAGLFSGLLAFGCSGGGGAGTPTVSTANDGGQVLLVAGTGGTQALIQFVKSASPDTGFSLAYADGHCEPRIGV